MVRLCFFPCALVSRRARSKVKRSFCTCGLLYSIGGGEPTAFSGKGFGVLHERVTTKAELGGDVTVTHVSPPVGGTEQTNGTEAVEKPMYSFFLDPMSTLVNKIYKVWTLSSFSAFLIRGDKR